MKRNMKFGQVCYRGKGVEGCEVGSAHAATIPGNIHALIC